MKNTIRIFIITCVLLQTALFDLKAQFGVYNEKEISKIKKGTTYIAINDTNSAASKQYMDIIKKNWTISKYQFIPYSEIGQHLAPENSFFTITYETSEKMGGPGSGAASNYSITYVFLELWTVEEKFFKKNKKELKPRDKYTVGRIELYTDYESIDKPSNILAADYGANDHIRNWGPGVFRNYLQMLMKQLNTNQWRNLYSKDVRTSEIKNLKKQVLYVPEYTLIEFGKFTGDESKKQEPKELFKDYRYKYEIITTKELNDKILNSTEPFYYLLYVKSGTDKYVSVINSKTGDVVYSQYTGPGVYNIKSSDLKELFSKINSN